MTIKITNISVCMIWQNETDWPCHCKSQRNSHQWLDPVSCIWNSVAWTHRKLKTQNTVFTLCVTWQTPQSDHNVGFCWPINMLCVNLAKRPLSFNITHAPTHHITAIFWQKSGIQLLPSFAYFICYQDQYCFRSAQVKMVHISLIQSHHILLGYQMFNYVYIK